MWGADAVDMHLISKNSKSVRSLLWVIEGYIKYVWVIPLKDKKDITVADAFQKIKDDSKRKPNRIWVDQSSEFYNRSFKLWLQGKTMI